MTSRQKFIAKLVNVKPLLVVNEQMFHQYLHTARRMHERFDISYCASGGRILFWYEPVTPIRHSVNLIGTYAATGVDHYRLGSL